MPPKPAQAVAVRKRAAAAAASARAQQPLGRRPTPQQLQLLHNGHAQPSKPHLVSTALGNCQGSGSDSSGKLTVATLLATGRLPKLLLQLGVVAVLAAAFYGWKLLPARSKLPPEVTPLQAPKMKALPEFDGTYKSRMLWGSYRSGLYFGMRTRTVRPLLLGLMWFDPDSLDTVYQRQIRHEAEQGDKLSSYAWLRHDGVSYGRQQLLDRGYNITITMAKQAADGAGYGGDWGVRIEAAKRSDWQQPAQQMTEGMPQSGRRLSLMLYIVDSHWHASELSIMPQDAPQLLGKKGTALAEGDNDDIGPWALHLRPHTPASAKGKPPKAALHHLGVKLMDSQQLVQLKDLALQAIVETARRAGTEQGLRLELPDIVQPGANLGMFQLTFEPGAAFDVAFVTSPEGEGAKQRAQGLVGKELTALAAAREAAFDAQWAERFGKARGVATEAAAQAGKDGGGAEERAVPDAAAIEEAAKAALSNLLGSMGYFSGSSRVQLPPGSPAAAAAKARAGGAPGSAPLPPGVVPYWRDVLFTATPSRSFFPRGFLWDEGFHQLLVGRWAPQLSRDAIAHWLDLMNVQGWIPREQILGKEARARVPDEFVVQHPSHANPPSLFLPLLAAARAVAAGKDGNQAAAHAADVAAQQAFLSQAWPRLEAWYGWFNRTQRGQLPGSFRWHGRNATTDRELNPKTLTSGLDDYPRASHPTDDERHVDLLCWMAFASQAMAEIGEAAGVANAAVAPYKAAAKRLSEMSALKQLHHDDASGQFLDWGLHTEDAELQKRSVQGPDGQQQEVTVRVVSSPPKRQLVPAFGYVSLFPLLTQLLPASSPELGKQLELLQDPALLWTQHGLRSLATTSSIYKKYNTEHDPPYWRGQIWVNINYLALRALHHYALQDGPHQQLARSCYAELRANLLTNLVGQYQTTGYLWEQYDDDSGKGLSSHPFTGWTALLALIATESW